MIHPFAIIPDRWYTSPVSEGASNNTVTSFVVERMNWFPVQCYKNGTVEAMGIYKTDTNTRSHTMRLGIYESDAEAGTPGALLEEFGTVTSGSSNDGIRSVAGSATVVAGNVYWLAIKVDIVAVTNTEPTMIRHNGGGATYPAGMFPRGLVGTAAAPSSIQQGLRLDSQGTGALPADVSGSTFLGAAANIPLPFFTFQADADVTDEGGWAWHGAFPYWQVIDAAH